MWPRGENYTTRQAVESSAKCHERIAESCGANYVAMHMQYSSALNWDSSLSEPSIASARLHLRFVTQPTPKTKNTHSFPKIILDVDDFQKTHTHTHTHTRFLLQRTWILKYHKPDGNFLGTTHYLYLSTLGYSFHENGAVILSRGPNGLSEPHRCSSIGWKAGENRNLFCEEQCCFGDPRETPCL